MEAQEKADAIYSKVYCSQEDVAFCLGVSRQYISKMVHKNQIPFEKVDGRAVILTTKLREMSFGRRAVLLRKAQKILLPSMK